MPVTVLSRCQRFDLRRVEAHELAVHYTRIAALEGVEADGEAIKLIAQAADGSVRDGLSLLDQAIARGGAQIAQADVKDMLGLADRAASVALCRQLCVARWRRLLTGSASWARGGDPLQTLQDLAGLIHRLTRAQIIAKEEALADWPEAERQLLAIWAM